MKIGKEIFDRYDLLAVEKLDAKEMRRRSKELSSKANATKNRHLAKIKPYELEQWLRQMADKSGKTLVETSWNGVLTLKSTLN